MVVHQILILVPLVAAVLDIAGLLSTLLGRLLVLASWAHIRPRNRIEVRGS